MKKIAIALVVLLALLLGACQMQGQQPEVPTHTEPATYTVTFQILDAVSAQVVIDGGLPQSLTSQFPGLQFHGWTDSDGNPVDPFAIPVTADATYTAVAYPVLISHNPFLFTDAAGLLHPDEALTCDDLQAALLALVVPGAEVYLPELPSSHEPVTQETLLQVLGCVFDSDTVNMVFGNVQALTRAEFAAGMHTLMGKDPAERFDLLENAAIPADVTMERTDAVFLLEASVAHQSADTGITWADVELPTSREPGFANMAGWLYYVKEDGYLLRDGAIGELYFGADGRYTTGDAELDQIVADLLNQFILENPEATRFELLRVAYDYCHQTFGYRRSWDDHPARGSHGWEVFRAKDIFQSGKGNCYGFAAAFWALARGLGYEARAISGVVLSDEQPHSWCFIEFDGKDYIFDPQWQFDYTRRGIFEHDMFFLPTDNLYFWGYQWFE